MARRGFLDYVLGGAVGGFEGLAQKRAADEEKARMATALARQVRMDAMEMEDRATAKEDREQAKKDRVQDQRQRALAGGYVPTGRDMPGAVERPFFDEQVIGGQTYRSYLTPGQFARKTAAEAAEFKAQFDPETMTPYQKEMIRQRTLDRLSREKASAGDDGDKANKAGISKIIGNAGKILETAREEERRAQTQLDNLDRIRPDPNRFSGTDEKFAAAEAAWQKKVDAAEKRLDEAQAKVGRMAPVYNMGALANDTTGFGEAFRDRPPAPPSTRSFDLFSPTANDKKFGTAFGTPAATPKPAPQAPGNTKEATLSAGAQRKINEIQSSDLTPEEKQEKVQQVNAILSREIMKIRGQR
jgi:hypothetical protein